MTDAEYLDTLDQRYGIDSVKEGTIIQSSRQLLGFERQPLPSEYHRARFYWSVLIRKIGRAIADEITRGDAFHDMVKDARKVREIVSFYFRVQDQ